MKCQEFDLSGNLRTEYGRVDKQGLFATEKEFNHASKLRRARFILSRGVTIRSVRKDEALIGRAGDEVVRVASRTPTN